MGDELSSHLIGCFIKIINQIALKVRHPLYLHKNSPLCLVVDNYIAIFFFVDTLLALAEAGHSMAVQELFSFPSRNCPDVLTLGLMQINPPMTNFR